jgi:hypothetical protein
MQVPPDGDSPDRPPRWTFSEAVDKGDEPLVRAASFRHPSCRFPVIRPKVGPVTTIRSKARKVLEKPAILGWKTSDPDEIRLRQRRGRAEIAAIEALEPQFGPFGAFRVRSTTGGSYDVEIRDLVAGPIPAAASTIASTVLGPASISKACSSR